MQKRILVFWFSWVIVSLAVAGCVGGTEEGRAGPGDVARGKIIYEQTVLGPNAAPGCITCHSTKVGATLVGPSHAGLADRAGSTVTGISAEEFLRESIVNPDAHIADGFAPGIMYQNFGKDLSEQEISDLVAYMLTLN